MSTRNYITPSMHHVSATMPAIYTTPQPQPFFNTDEDRNVAMQAYIMSGGRVQFMTHASQSNSYIQPPPCIYSGNGYCMPVNQPKIYGFGGWGVSNSMKQRDPCRGNGCSVCCAHFGGIGGVGCMHNHPVDHNSH